MISFCKKISFSLVSYVEFSLKMHQSLWMNPLSGKGSLYASLPQFSPTLPESMISWALFKYVPDWLNISVNLCLCTCGWTGSRWSTRRHQAGVLKYSFYHQLPVPHHSVNLCLSLSGDRMMLLVPSPAHSQIHPMLFQPYFPAFYSETPKLSSLWGSESGTAFRVASDLEKFGSLLRTRHWC